MSKRPLFRRLRTMPRVVPELHGLLGHEPYAPAKLDRVLVWPSEGVPPRPETAALFQSVRFESGYPEPTTP